jgi:hypothetical protein
MHLNLSAKLAAIATSLLVVIFPCSGIAAPVSTQEWSADKTKAYFSDLNDLNPGEGWDSAYVRFRATHGGGPYPVKEIKEYHLIKQPVQPKQGFQGLKIRGNYDDVLSSEDPTVANARNGRADLNGAQFSYTRDYQNQSHSWGAVGAFIAPFSWHYPTHTRVLGPIELESAGFIPSVSFNRVTSSKDAANDVDSLLFRLGAFAKTTGGGTYSQTFRLFGRYGTDFGFRSEAPAAEIEYEPAFDMGDLISFGSLHRIYPLDFDDPEVKPPHQVVYRLRTYLHAEYGGVQDRGTAISAREEEFCRAGPIVELNLTPLFWDSLSCKISYEYLGNFAGRVHNRHLFKVEPAWDLSDLAALKAWGASVSLKASYQDGAIGVTDAPVRTLFIGLGITL